MWTRGATKADREKVLQFLVTNRLSDPSLLKEMLAEDRMMVLEDYSGDSPGFHGTIFTIVWGDSAFVTVVYKPLVGDMYGYDMEFGPAGSAVRRI